MLFKNKIFTALLILFVFTGQAIAADGVNSCNMNMSQSSMDYCDNNDCTIDCNLSIVFVLSEIIILADNQVSPQKIHHISSSTISKSFTPLYRPPITR